MIQQRALNLTTTTSEMVMVITAHSACTTHSSNIGGGANDTVDHSKIVTTEVEQ